MCYSPTLIKNPNRGRHDSLAYLVDTNSQYIPVPCGHCGECIALRSSAVHQRVLLEELAGYPFFITLTYNNESLAYYECSNGFKIPYSPISDLQNMFKRLRKNESLTRRFRYYAITELGSKKGRPHAHILLFLERLAEDSVYTPINLEKIVWSEVLKEWRRNYGSTRNPDYRPLCTFIQRMKSGKLNSTFDCHYVFPSLSGTTQDVSYYVTKYLCKDSVFRDKLKKNLFGHLDFEEASEVWNKIKPRAISSLNFGFGIYDDINPRKTSKSERLAVLSGLESAKLVRDSILRSSISEKTPKFFDVQTGKALPLARYWYKFGSLLPVDVYEKFVARQDRVDGVSIDDRSMTSKLLSEQKFVRNSVDSKQSNFDLLYD